jgi:hypothetical protein
MTDPSLELSLKAMESFKDWSNYMLVTTVAALGWVAKQSDDHRNSGWYKFWYRVVVISLTLSIILAIFTLAVIPILTEQLGQRCASSIYDVVASVKPIWSTNLVKVRVWLTLFCWPQHVTFLVGVVAFAVMRLSFRFSAGAKRSKGE